MRPHQLQTLRRSDHHCEPDKSDISGIGIGLLKNAPIQGYDLRKGEKAKMSHNFRSQRLGVGNRTEWLSEGKQVFIRQYPALGPRRRIGPGWPG